MATVTHLFLKPGRGLPMTSANTLTCLAGTGIKNNANNGPLTPRQVLVTRKEDLDELSIAYGSLRENIILEGATPENFRPGSLVSTNMVAIRLLFYCEPCKRIIGVVPDLKSVIHKRGILGVVTAGGEIRVKDEVVLLPDHCRPLSELPYERFLDFMQYVPLGKVVTYAMICKGIGVGESFCRAIPGYIEKALPANSSLPFHRIVDSFGRTAEQFIPGQVASLMGEDIMVTLTPHNRHELPEVSLDKYLWGGNPVYTTE